MSDEEDPTVKLPRGVEQGVDSDSAATISEKLAAEERDAGVDVGGTLRPHVEPGHGPSLPVGPPTPAPLYGGPPALPPAPTRFWRRWFRRRRR